jgi:hypothetical protein
MNTEIDKNLLERNNIAERKKFTATPIALLLLAAVTLGITFALDDASESKMPLMFLGIVFFIFGVVKLMTMPKVLFHITSEEELSAKTLFFDSNEKNMVLDMLAKGEFTKLKSKARASNNLPVKVELYSTVSESIVLYRAYSFVPYTYEPITEYEVYKK